MSQDAPPSTKRTYRQVPTALPTDEDAFRDWFSQFYSALTGKAATGSAEEWHARYLRLRSAFRTTATDAPQSV